MSYNLPKQLSICFYGSSDHEIKQSLASKYSNEIDAIIDKILKLDFDNFKIVTGGYGGIMDLVAKIFQNKKREFPKKNIEIIGIACDAYEFENPGNSDYNSSNDYSPHNDVIIQAGNFADRVQAMIELSDLFIVLPGKQGSLHELLITCESYSYGKYILNGKKGKLWVHDYWQPLLSDERFFRKFDDQTLNYFNSDDISTLLSNLAIEETKCQEGELDKEVPLTDEIQSRFLKLKNGISKAILGRLYDQTETLYRIGKHNEDLLLGLDFGWFMTNSGSAD